MTDSNSIFQLLPPLTDTEYAELKADIAKRGVLVPVEYDEDENIIDGHHRVKACLELGVTAWPRLVRRGLSEDEKKSIALVLNLARRHLTNKQKAPVWKYMRDLGMTLEAIAQADGAVSKSTVHEALKEQLSDSGKLTGKLRNRFHIWEEFNATALSGPLSRQSMGAEEDNQNFFDAHSGSGEICAQNNPYK